MGARTKELASHGIGMSVKQADPLRTKGRALEEEFPWIAFFKMLHKYSVLLLLPAFWIAGPRRTQKIGDLSVEMLRFRWQNLYMY